jgi:S1-C subfamily serine protease
MDEDITFPSRDSTLAVEPPPAAESPARPRGRRWIAGAALAAVLGALVGGGLVAALDDEASAPGAAPGRPAAALRGKPLDVHGVLSRVQPATVSVTTEIFRRDLFFGGVQRATGAGTGMIISADGEVLTNAHVIEGASTIEVTADGERTARPADLVGSDPDADVAVLKIRGAHDLPTVTLGRSGDLQVGDDVIAIGNALALAGGPTVTRGIVSALNRTVTGEEQLGNLIQTDAAINSGNSGGPLVDAAGEVVGVNTVVIQQAPNGALVQNIGFAIPIDGVRDLVARLRGGQGPVRGGASLGVSAVTLTRELRDRFGLKAETGALVDVVDPSSPADDAGLQRFDVVISFAGKAVTSAEQLVQDVRDHRPGDEVALVWMRGDRRMEARVTLSSRPVTTR